MSDKISLLNREAPWYKGNLHTHTTRSDGKLSPEEACEFYRSRGYSFLAITDHRTFYKAEEQEGFTLLGGCELDFNDMEARSAFHIIGIGIERQVPFTLGDRPEKLVRGICEAGGLAVLGIPTGHC